MYILLFPSKTVFIFHIFKHKATTKCNKLHWQKDVKIYGIKKFPITTSAVWLALYSPRSLKFSTRLKETQHIAEKTQTTATLMHQGITYPNTGLQLSVSLNYSHQNGLDLGQVLQTKSMHAQGPFPTGNTLLCGCKRVQHFGHEPCYVDWPQGKRTVISPFYLLVQTSLWNILESDLISFQQAPLFSHNFLNQSFCQVKLTFNSCVASKYD